MSAFRPGLETIMEGVSAPIVPVYMHNLWGSMFSYEGGRALFKWPKKLFGRITVIFGEPLPASASANEVERAVRELKAHVET